MYDRILDLKQKGYNPDLVLDIGAEKGSWTRDIRPIFSEADYILFEAIDYPELHQMINSKTTVVRTVLFDSQTEVDWYEMKNTGDSIFREKSHHFDNCIPTKKQTSTLNSVMKMIPQTETKKNIFIKIDCQGAEIPILKGASDILSRTDFIVLEIPLFGQYNQGVPGFLEHIQFMDTIGFVPYDIAANHYINGFTMQIDMIFISKQHSFNTLVQQRMLV
jgi:FkbM family methyltransferase